MEDIMEGFFINKGWIRVSDSSCEESSLVGVKCINCHEIYFPPKAVCPNCWGRKLKNIDIGRTGTLVNFTVSRVAPKGFNAPYVQAFVKLDEGPVIFSLISGVNYEDINLKKGQRLGLVIESICTDENNEPILGWKYKPVEKNISAAGSDVFAT
jgi:uncharacterized protein